LGEHFNTIDLRVDGPGFEIEKLPHRAVTGVSLALPNVEPRMRMAILRQFATQRAHYKRKQIWASVTNVRTAQELEVCVTLGVPFVTGPAVSGPRRRPLGGHICPLDSLPPPMEVARREHC